MSRWCEATNLPRGVVMPLAQCWELGKRWYADRLSPGWKPKTLEVMRGIFREVGLDGDFWTV